MDRLVTIDCEYLGHEFAASYLRIRERSCAIVETNTSYAVPRILAALWQAGMTPESVEAIVITHVHLDHAGGTSELLKHCPNAKVYAHPRAARHLIDPSKLVASATAVYGAERFSEWYGKMEPVPADRVVEWGDGASIDLAGAPLQFFHTRGHAKHHGVIYDRFLDTVFTGDALGVCYPVLCQRGIRVIPSTSPTDFEYEEAILTLEKIRTLGTSRVHLTHYGEVRDLPEAIRQMKFHLDHHEALRRSVEGSGLSFSAAAAKIEGVLREHYRRAFDGAEEAFQVLELDTQLNAQGLAWAAGLRD